MGEEVSRGPGRPTAYSDEVHRIIVENLADGQTIKTACELAGISYRTFHGWTQRAEENEEPFLTLMQDAMQAKAQGKQKLHGIVEKAATGYTVTKMSASGKIVEVEEFDWKAAAWLLERTHGEEYGNRASIEHHGSDDKPPIQVESPRDRLAARLAEVAKRQVIEGEVVDEDDSEDAE